MVAQYLKNNHIIHHIKRLRKKNYMIISIDSEKAFDKITIHVKTLSKLGIEGNFLNLMKDII